MCILSGTCPIILINPNKEIKGSHNLLRVKRFKYYSISNTIVKMKTTIQVSDEIWEELNKRKKRGETFEEVLKRLLLKPQRILK